MQLKKFEGFIVDEKSYKETSKILNIITKDGLKIGVVSKGCKKMKSNLRSVSQKFTYANFIISYKEDGLSTLISADIINPFLNIKKDIEKIYYFNFITDLTNQVIKQSNNKNIYDTFYNNKDIIEEKTGLKYKWQRLDNKKACRIKAIKKCNVEEQEEWEEAFKWFCENALKIKEEFNKVFNK